MGARLLCRLLVISFSLLKRLLSKIQELVLATIIEQKLSKNEILELYLNKIFLGHRAYGIGPQHKFTMVKKS